MRRRPGGFPRRRSLTFATLIAGGILLVLFSGLLGAVAVPASTGIPILLHRLSGGALYPGLCSGANPTAIHCRALTTIVWEIYFPQVLLALLVGAGLGISGGALQGVFRNPLADPFLLGISSGGTLGAAILYVYRFQEANAVVFLPLFAFVGATATGLLILVIARGRLSSIETLLLTGVALANLLSAVLSLVLLYNPVGGQQATFWLLGGLALASWPVDEIAFGALLALGTLLVLYGRELNLLQLGPDVAQSAGVDSAQVRVRVILLASLTTAVAVAFTGIIGFVGLVSPHVVRRIAGTDYRVVLPGAAAVGALFLLGARDLNFLVFPNSILPIGIFTAFAGVPFFLYLLYRQRRAVTMGVV
jgi:cobalamin transport system permease protein